MARPDPDALIALPPPYADHYTVFERHFWYWQAKRRQGGQAHDRPSLGQLAMTSGLSRRACQKYRTRLEAGLPPEARPR